MTIRPKYGEKNCVIWTQTGLLFMLKLKILTKILQTMLKNNLTHEIMKL